MVLETSQQVVSIHIERQNSRIMIEGAFGSEKEAFAVSRPFALRLESLPFP